MSPTLQELLNQRIPLDTLPTPLVPCRSFLNTAGVRVDLKRDDLIGDLLTGTKMRALSYVLWQAIEDGVTDLITIGESSSNQCRLVAILGAQLGLTSHILLRSPSTPLPEDENLAIMNLYGARIQFLEEDEWRLHGLAVKRHMLRIRKSGGKALFIPFGCGGLPGALGIIDLVREIKAQRDGTLPYSHIIVPTGSGATLFALDLGLQLLGSGMGSHGDSQGGSENSTAPGLLGASVAQEAPRLLGQIDQHYTKLGLALGSAFERSQRVTIEDRWRDASPPQLLEALQRVVSTYGVLPDPLYVLRAFLTLEQQISTGEIDAQSNVLILITGASRTLVSTQHEVNTLHATP